MSDAGQYCQGTQRLPRVVVAQVAPALGYLASIKHDGLSERDVIDFVQNRIEHLIGTTGCKR
jgi:hypothetical protein